MKSRVKSHDPHEEESRDLMRSKEETSEGLSERVKLLEDRLVLVSARCQPGGLRNV